MKKDLKNIIKQTVDNHSDDINPEMIWAGIEDKLSPKKKKKFLGLWMVSMLGIGVLVSMLWWQMDNHKEETEISHLVDAKIEVNENLGVGSKIEVSDIEKTELDDKEIVRKNENVEVSDLDKNKSIVKEAKIEQKIFTRNSVNTLVMDSERNEVWNETVSTTQSQSQSQSESQFSINKELGIASTTLPTLGKSSKKYIDQLEISQVAQNDLKAFDIPERNMEEIDHEEYSYDYPVYGKEKTISFLSSVEVFSGLSFGSKTISDIDPKYASERNESEQFLEQWNAGIRLDLIKVLDFKIETGLSYSMLTDRWNMQKEVSEYVDWTYTKSILIGADGSVLDSMQVTDSLLQVSSRAVTQYNSQRIVSIPIGVSFGRSINRFNVGIGFGVDINYQLGDRHLIQGKDGLPEINRVGGSWVSPSFNGYLQSEYLLNDQWAVSSRFNFRGLTLSDHESISTLKSSYQLYGLELGIKRYFGTN